MRGHIYKNLYNIIHNYHIKICVETNNKIKAAFMTLLV